MIRAMYDELLSNGELKFFMPNAMGKWEKDKEEFIFIFKAING